ncbi:hypothetical protein BurJ1DRAFT_0702 [Burkholderiales bacterium JOSHI_001]|nr:hypothetical protein BurJ1DRAFT_0702 [Burkholderiales bacterium JOSHI_001]
MVKAARTRQCTVAATSPPRTAHERMKPLLTATLLAALAPGAAAAPLTCLGDTRPMVVDHQMPYAQVRVGQRSGYFVLDFGATVSSITPSGFAAPGAPTPVPGTADRYDGFDFFGPWGRVQLALQGQAPATSRVRQAGVIGTDFLASHIYTLDYRAGRLHRAAPQGFCTDATLAAAGFRALSTRDHYAETPQRLSCPLAGGPPNCVNVPTVPLRIGPLQTGAQLDTGYDDGRRPYSLNINAALFEALQRQKVPMKPRPDIALQLSTCVPGLSETVEAWQLAARLPFGLQDTAGATLAVPSRQVTLFVKRTPPAARACGGIGTWSQPAAQLGASFVARGALVVDPFSQRVWLRPR